MKDMSSAFLFDQGTILTKWRNKVQTNMPCGYILVDWRFPPFLRWLAYSLVRNSLLINFVSCCKKSAIPQNPLAQLLCSQNKREYSGYINFAKSLGKWSPDTIINMFLFKIKLNYLLTCKVFCVENPFLNLPLFFSIFHIFLN